jgi:hypothetical protein
VQKFTLLSILLASISIPMIAARSRSARVGFRRLIVWAVAFNVAYVIAVIYVLPRLPF